MKTKTILLRQSALMLLSLAAFSTLNSQLSTVFAQGTAFTYQGRLNSCANPAAGLYDLRFTIFDSTNIPGNVIAGPITNFSTAVSNGLFAVTLDFGPGVFNGAPYWLEVGVRTNTGGAFTTLAPREPLPPSPYAIFAEGANAAGLNGTIPPANIGNGSITANQLAAGAAVSNLNASGQAGVPSGGIVLSATDNNAALQNAGYVKVGTTQLNEVWQQVGGDIPPSARYLQTAVWTGSEMIVWGGRNPSGALYDGGRYNPAANIWTTVNVTTAPGARYEHTAVWTGTQMIVWGGYNGGALNDGASYSPAADTWTPVTTTGAPSARENQTAVWTGSQMIVWGGFGGGGVVNDGGTYNPAADSWTALPTTGAPAARYGHTAVWTGSEMIVWGGATNVGLGEALYGDGGRYNPTSNSWTAVTTTGAPVARWDHTAVWTGSEMIVWGGLSNNSSGFLNTGGGYNPMNNSWTAVTTTGAPSARESQTAVWTGSEMIVWGGYNGSSYFNDGGRYNPVGDSWIAVVTNGAPAARVDHTAVWTGSEMIVWGGVSNTTYYADGGRFSPVGGSWTAVTTNGPPAARYNHSAVWTGSEMIVWGGVGAAASTYFNNGGIYNPIANTWTAVPTNGAPTGRYLHTAVWTGTEMIVWGGDVLAGGAINAANDGGRYNPATNGWTPVTTTGAPAARVYHTAVWTGSAMIVWGGTALNTIFNDGGLFNPTSNTWTAVTTTGAPAGRSRHTAVWTGTEMIVWGGGTNVGLGEASYNTGGRYNPTGNNWTAVTTTGAPEGRYAHTAVWTGSEMIVWGGGGSSGFLNDGGRYSPAGDSWSASTLTTGAPAARYGQTAVWTGSEMIVWGGYDGSYFNDGGRYNPTSDSWIPVTTLNAPVGRVYNTVVWTGSSMIIFGGQDASGIFGDTWSYTPGMVVTLYQKP